MNAKFLPFEENRFVKSISVETVSHEEPFWGDIIYVRKASEAYWYKPVPIGMTWKERFERDVYGRSEDEFPSDLLDKLILKGIQSVYPNASIKTRGINFDLEREEIIKYLSSRKEAKQNLLISPSPAGLQIGDLIKYTGQEFMEFTRSLSLFCIGDNAQDVFVNNEYHLYYPLAIASDIEELLKLYDREIYGVDMI